MTQPPPHPEPAETPLTGGRLTPGVVRVGDTVRRPATAASPFVAALLNELRRRGFTGAPRHLGRDDRGRDVLEYLPGRVPARFRRWSDGQVADAARLLRALHDATRDSRLAEGHPVVCHHDAGPNNAVFRAGRPVAFIDFDLAAPGDPLSDLGYLGWSWGRSGRRGAAPPPAQAAQLRLAADAYGLTRAARGRLVDAVLARQLANADFWRARAARGPAAEAERCAARVAWSLDEHAHVTAHRATFTAALR